MSWTPTQSRIAWRPTHGRSVLVSTPPQTLIEPLTLAEGKLRAGLDWPDGDPRDPLMRAFISAARAQVEKDTTLALPLQIRDVMFDALPGPVIDLPAQCAPIQAITTITSYDGSGTARILDGSQYAFDRSGRIGLTLGAAWPTDLRPFQPWIVRIVAGWPTPAALLAEEPLLVHCVGLLTAHYATLGRDLAAIDTATETPMSYADAIASYVPYTVA